MKIPKISKEKIIYCWVGLMFAVVLALYIFLYEPLIYKLKKTGNICRAVESEVIEKRKSLSALKISEIKKILINKKEISLAIAELTKYGKLKEINFISIKSMPIIEIGDPEYAVLPIEMDIESTYEGLIEFIDSFNELKESLVTLGDFSVISNIDTEALKIKLIINTYIPVTQIGTSE